MGDIKYYETILNYKKFHQNSIFGYSIPENIFKGTL